MPDETSDALPEVELFTDGACLPNPGPGGYGVVLKLGRHRKELSGAFKETTNNRMELMAAIVGLRALNRRCRVKLITDSEYLAESLNRGSVQRWRDNGWWRSPNQRAANHDLWTLLLELVASHDVQAVWTRGHAGQADNERCDALARQAIGSASAAVDEGWEQSKNGGPQSIAEGHPCFKCRTPVVKRHPKKRRGDATHSYNWYLYCPACASVYMVHEGKAPISNASVQSLFKEFEADA